MLMKLSSELRKMVNWKLNLFLKKRKLQVQTLMLVLWGQCLCLSSTSTRSSSSPQLIQQAHMTSKSGYVAEKHFVKALEIFLDSLTPIALL